MKSNKVRFWEIRPNKTSKNGKEVIRSYTVRWIVAGRESSQTFARKAQADRFKAKLMAAAEREAFDIETGLPDSMRPAPEPEPVMTWYELTRKYVEVKWPGQPAKTRSSMVDALATVTPALVVDDAGKPDIGVLRKALIRHAYNPGREAAPDELADVLRWLEVKSLPVPELIRADNVRLGLNALARTLDGKAAAATTTARKRAVFHNVLKFAVREEKLLDSNPLHDVDWSAPDVVTKVDPRTVPNPAQGRQLLASVTYVGRRKGRGRRLHALFACMYYAALRPGEAVGLRRADCVLPKQGWGKLMVGRNLPQAGKRYTDSGEFHDSKGLKHRGEGEVRPVPIPPLLVQLLRDHVAEFGVASDGRLFATSTGGVIASSAYWHVWQQARLIGLTPDQVTSPLAQRPYDLRHAAVTTWLNAGVPAPEIAKRVGHSEEVLWKVYAGCIDGDEARINRLIEAALTA